MEEELKCIVFGINPVNCLRNPKGRGNYAESDDVLAAMCAGCTDEDKRVVFQKWPRTRQNEGNRSSLRTASEKAAMGRF